MAFRSQAFRIIACLIALLAASRSLPAEERQFAVRHRRLLKDHPGALVFDQQGVRFTPADQKKPSSPLTWRYADIQQLWVSPQQVKLLTYEDRAWLFGADREFVFTLPAGAAVAELARFLRALLDARLVTAIGSDVESELWAADAKLTGWLTGAAGRLRAGGDSMVFETSRKEWSRTWRYLDIDNISQSGPWELTLVTHERSAPHYGSRRAFVFQLKRPLTTAEFDAVWQRLERSQGLEFLTRLKDRELAPTAAP